MAKRSLAVVASLHLALTVGGCGWFRAQSADAERSPPPSRATSTPGAPLPGPRERPLPSGSISGRITTRTGAPLPGALVCARVDASPLDPHRRSPLCATATDDGRYTLASLPPDRWLVFASAEGHHARFEDRRALQLDGGEARTGVDLSLVEGGRVLRGRLKSAEGRGIADALVTVGDTSASGQGATAATRSDAQGAFAVGVEEGWHLLQIRADGYADALSYAEAPGPLVEVLMAPGARISGRVVDATSGAPLAGARVDPGPMHVSGVFPDEAVTTDAQGRFQMERLAPGRYGPSARASGRFGQARHSLLLGLGQAFSDLVIEAHPASDVAGRVLVEPGKRPCTSGFVSLTSPSQPGQTAPLGRDGWARFEGLLPALYRALVVCENQVLPGESPSFELGTKNRADLTWVFPAGLTLRGRVVDPKGHPLRVPVHASPLSPQTTSAPNGYGQTDEEGRFVLRGLAAGAHRVSAVLGHPEPRTHADVDLVAEGTPERTLVMPTAGRADAGQTRRDGPADANAGNTIEGLITDAQQNPLQLVEIGLGNVATGRTFTTMSGMDGRFALTHLMPGAYRIRASLGGAPLPAPMPHTQREPAGATGTTPNSTSARPPATVLAQVQQGKTTSVRLIVESQQGVIQGRVLDGAGQPVSDALVYVQRDMGGSLPDGLASTWGSLVLTPVTPDPAGRFTLQPLQSQGIYTVHAQRKDGGAAVVENVRVGQTLSLTIRKRATLSGTVSLPEGPPPQFVLTARRDGVPIQLETFFQTGGAWTLDDLQEGSYEIQITAPEGTGTSTVRLAAGEERGQVRIALTRRATLKGKLVTLEDGAPLSSIHVSIQTKSTQPVIYASEHVVSDASGQFQLDKVEAGQATLMATPATGPDSLREILVMPIEVPPGGIVDLGALPLAKRRLAPSKRAGDLGFTVRSTVSAVRHEPNELQVETVRAGSSAARAGLVAGDVITSVDGHDVTSRRGYLYRQLTTVPAGTTITLGLARGARVAIVAE
ncbi:carboxypeptidase regulatory-like domain-containing protein [Chondromyces crocatus]|uniref:PDZ domain-containing protein n=1 Tax=Chondromyces crocatus TaxID=52 RepID=A0A0K1EQ08_CHOCO|nr:carboxypeptidase regulatory-like domain-containing protein [Chondromyces crocatus]AKT42698.1 uncharacterized protein CMC5_069250 [Chondromyces crocatus]